ncbi:Protein cpl1 [Vanrija albida]|uniref:Protein cpl1 n=1 Tax=Vanrija albida TaxID=181172 RepID=A0ABR3PW86_9TREE
MHLTPFALLVLAATPSFGFFINPGHRRGAAPATAAKAPAPAPKPLIPAPLDAPPKLQPRAPQASKRMGQRRRSKKSDILVKKDYSSFLCPGGAVACPVPAEGFPATPEGVALPEYATKLDEQLASLGDWFKVGFECLELDSELNQCGGCLALGQGQDCSTIANTRATGCEKGVCAVYSCMPGYTVSADKKECVRSSDVGQAVFQQRR